jgi:hypothetical protein
MAETALNLAEIASNYCSLAAKPLLLTGFFRDILSQHFADPDRIYEPHLVRMIWSKNRATSKILVETLHKWQPQTTGQRPAIVIKRNGYKSRRICITGQYQGNHLRNGGGSDHVQAWAGSHTLFCIGATGGQAELLANEVQRHLVSFAHIYAGMLGFLRFSVMSIGEVRRVEESREHFVVPVSVSYMYTQSWAVQEAAPLLRKITIEQCLDI